MSLEGAVTVRGASRAESSWGLTAREREIIDDVSAGRSNIDIAARHGISVRTIETHMRNIRRKTGAVNRDEIASFGAAGDVERARR
nr:helix-turn-helix transcriptional regulator [Microbacterium sp. B19(2022)]